MENQSGARTIGSLTAAGLPLAAGLRACALELFPGPERSQLTRIATALESGASLDEALNRYGARPADLGELIRTGSETGHFSHILDEYVMSLRECHTLWRRFYVSLIYPLLLFSLTVLLCCLFMLLAVPQFRRIFEDFGIELPAMTQLLLAAQQWAAPIAVIVVILLVSLPFWPFLHRVLPGQRLRTILIDLLPISGQARRRLAAAEFCARLSVLIDAGVSLPEAMSLVSKTLSDVRLRQVAGALAERLQRGHSPRDYIDGFPGLLPEVAGTFRWADDPQAFSEGLKSLAQVLTVQAEVRLQQFSLTMAPINIVIVGAVAGFVIAACFLPLVKLLNALS